MVQLRSVLRRFSTNGKRVCSRMCFSCAIQLPIDLSVLAGVTGYTGHPLLVLIPSHILCALLTKSPANSEGHSSQTEAHPLVKERQIQSNSTFNPPNKAATVFSFLNDLFSDISKGEKFICPIFSVPFHYTYIKCAQSNQVQMMVTKTFMRTKALKPANGFQREYLYKIECAMLSPPSQNPLLVKVSFKDKIS